MLRPRSWLALALALAAAAPPAPGQVPKRGREVYEDTTDLGFRLRAPDGWQFIPPSPDDANLIGKYDAGPGKVIADKGGKDHVVEYIPYSMWLLKFDRRPAGEDGAKVPADRLVRAPARDVVQWVEAGNAGGVRFLKDLEEPFKAKREATEVQFQGRFGDEEPVRLYAVVHHLTPATDVAVVFIGPGDGARDGKWRRLTRAYKAIAGSLEPVEVVRPAGRPAGAAPRERKRFELEQEVARAPGWELHETPNYFIVTNSTDKGFLLELAQRLEGIRRVFEETFPPAMAQELRTRKGRRDAPAPAPAARVEEPTAGVQEPARDDAASGAGPGGVIVAARPDPMELSRTSVVRVCRTREEYHSYGGPPGTGGYWNPGARELVLFDDQQVLGRDETFGTLSHEAFHQYIFYFFGSIAPHSWFNEGHGDFYAGFAHRHGRFELDADQERRERVREVLRSEARARPGERRRWVPLRELVRYTQRQYYGEGDQEVALDNYALGWSLVHFLRTGAARARCWRAEWDGILDTYLRTLVETDDLDAAVEAAFAGIDTAALERCWKDHAD